MAGKVGRPRKVVPATSEATVLTPEDFDVPDTGDDADADQALREQADAAREKALAGATATPTTGQLAEAVMALVQNQKTMLETQPVKRVPWSKFKTRSPFNPKGDKRRKLTRRCYQNGFPMNIRTVHDEEIALLNQLQEGRYINGMVRVVIAENGGNTDLHIIYKNASADDKLANAAEWRNLTELLKRCVQESSAVASV